MKQRWKHEPGEPFWVWNPANGEYHIYPWGSLPEYPYVLEFTPHGWNGAVAVGVYSTLEQAQRGAYAHYNEMEAERLREAERELGA